MILFPGSQIHYKLHTAAYILTAGVASAAPPHSDSGSVNIFIYSTSKNLYHTQHPLRRTSQLSNPHMLLPYSWPEILDLGYT